MKKVITILKPFVTRTAIWRFDVITHVATHITGANMFPLAFQYSMRLF